MESPNPDDRSAEPNRRWLRVAVRAIRGVVSIACLLACIGFAVLWVRSYWKFDSLQCRVGKKNAVVQSANGSVKWYAVNNTDGWDWTFTTAELPNDWAPIDLKPPGPHDINIQPLTAWWDTRRQTVWARTWLPTYVFGALAVLPWVKWRARYRLRTLLIVMAVVALLFGFVALAK